MSLHLLRHDEAFGGVLPAARGMRRSRWGDAAPWPSLVRLMLWATAVLGLLTFVLGVGNRFTRGPLFIYIPEVDLIPPLGKAAWQQAFVIHQQNPLYALCGGYQVGGMESLTVYQMLYMWEWLRLGSAFLLVACCLWLAAMVTRRLAGAVTRGQVHCVMGLVAFAAAYLMLRYFADHAGLFATINIGQHRHALDVTFASLAVAMLLAAAISDQFRAPSRIGMVFAALVAVDIAFGALFEATDAGVVWTTFPGYADGALPGPDRLFAFSPAWRNLTENLYLIQACHRLLSFALWGTALTWLAAAMLRGRGLAQPALLFGLLTLEAALGVATLLHGEPLALSIVHQVWGVLVLAVAIAPTAADGALRTRPGSAPVR